MSDYLPGPLLGKSGHSLQHLWKNGSYCEFSLGEQFPAHPLQWRGCGAWSRVSFINWGLGFWDLKLSLPTQVIVCSDMTLVVLCLHQHRFTIPGNFAQEEKITLLCIPRTLQKDPSTLQQKISAIYTSRPFQPFPSKSLPCCVHQL